MDAPKQLEPAADQAKEGGKAEQSRSELLARTPGNVSACQFCLCCTKAACHLTTFLLSLLLYR